MIRCRCALLLLVFGVLCRSGAWAQPLLPDIASAAVPDGVVLSWNCQYNGVKGITVMRSRDSLSDYEIVGYVKKVEKGVQEFRDRHPYSGRNYYKLAIIFSSGLTWRSNYTGVDFAAVPPAVPKEKEPVKAAPPASQMESSFGGKPKVIPDTCGKGTGRPGVGISFRPDTAPVPRPRIKLVIDEQPADNAAIFMRSRFVATDSSSGHVNITLPDDVATHHYSLRFYDIDKHFITEIPRINSQRLILDKRNFQKKGTYKFVLRRDVVELESGYLVIDPSR